MAEVGAMGTPGATEEPSSYVVRLTGDIAFVRNEAGGGDRAAPSGAMLLPSIVKSSGGAFCALRFLRRRSQNTSRPTPMRNTSPPTTPPAIAPAFDFPSLLGGSGDDSAPVGDSVGASSLDVLESEGVDDPEVDEAASATIFAWMGPQSWPVKVVTSMYAHCGTSTSSGMSLGYSEMKRASEGQFSDHRVQFCAARPWHRAHALVREKTTVLQLQGVAPAADGPR